jgi:hypothetical protein
MAELEFPKCISNQISQKRMMISIAEDMCTVTNETAQKDNTHQIAKLIIVTQSGIIKGIPASDEEYNNKEIVKVSGEHEATLNLFAIGNQKNLDLIECEKKNSNLTIMDNSSYINLNNANFINLNNVTFHFNSLTVFVDQILGYSIEFGIG